MYTKSLLLNALDSVIESAHDRLTPDELQLLKDIRNGIADTDDNDDEGMENQFTQLVNWLLTIIKYIELLT